MSPTKERSKQPAKGFQASVATDQEATSVMNLALMDPPRWGWAAVGGISDLLPPHERARRKITRTSFRENKQRNPTVGQDSTISLPPTGSVDISACAMRKYQSQMESCSSVAQMPLANEMILAEAMREDDSLFGLIGKPVSEPNTPFQTSTTAAGVTSDTTRGFADARKANTSLRDPQQDPHLKKTGDVCSNLHGHRLGIPVQCLGISLAETRKRPTEKVSTTADRNVAMESINVAKNRETSKNELVVHAMSDGVLDMYAYHRGREGMEPRDPDTGQLLCDVKSTDNMHNWDAPRMIVTITIFFSLEGGGSVNNTGIIGEGEEDETRGAPQYSDTIQWDLSDTTTPAPISYATSIAEEFGLSSGQTLDLAKSIQQQLDAHVAQKCAYVDPFTLKDPSGTERLLVGPPRLSHRYGAVMDTTEPGGMPLSRKEISQRQRKIPNVSRRLSTGVYSSKGPTSNGSSRRRKLVHPPPERQTKFVVQNAEEESKVEEKYRNEVFKRAREASMLDCAAKTRGVMGALKKQSDHHCHICHKRCQETFVFPCGNISHSFCTKHCKERLGMTMRPGEPPKLNYCPICCVECTCSQCSRKADAVARIFKEECKEQGKSVEAAVLDDILSRCSVNVQARTQRVVVTIVEPVEPASSDADGVSEQLPTLKTLARRGRGGDQKRPLVARPPPSEFPQELCGVKDLEPGTTTDYKTVFTSNGNYVCESLSEMVTETHSLISVSASNDPEVPEDGNVDYCHVCMNHGNLLCCDFCPRAFHAKCIEGEVQPSGSKWECFVCRKDKGLEADGALVDGKKSLDLICGSFFEANAGSDSMEKLQILSMIHQMVTKLIDYDFGYMFAEPVNLDEVSGYKDTVKNPMDLGTIGSKLINGGYSNQLKARQSWDDVVAAVLKDVELVWHNCFTFNYEDSAIYRMATVHRRKAQSIRERSFDHLLSDQVKAEVDAYVISCEQARGCYSSTSLTTQRRGPGSRSACRPKGKHKITVTQEKTTVHRAVAILDPSSSRIVKTYSSMKSACQAAQLLAGLDFNCEWSTLNEFSVKGVMHKSPADPSILLFGYRWLLLDDLRNGKVVFAKASSDILEMKYKSSTHLFFSIDEALSFSGLPKTISFEKLRQELSSLPRGDDWFDIGKRSWRRPRIHRPGPDENESPETTMGPPSFLKNGYIDDSVMLKHSVLAKEDLVSGRRLIGFESVQAAFEDWVGTCQCSPSFPDVEELTVERFQQFYLDGDRNVDGVVWRTVRELSHDLLTSVENSSLYDNEDLMENGQSIGLGIEPSSAQTQGPNNRLQLEAGAIETFPGINGEIDSASTGAIVLRRGCDLSNGDDSSYLGKRKRVSMDIERSVKSFAAAEHKNDCSKSVESVNRKSGTLIANGKFST